MSLDEDFEAAQVRLKRLAQTPAPNELLDIYSLYKQAVAGDASGPRPGMLDFKGRAKYDAWATRAGMPKAEAMAAYVALVGLLAGKYGSST